MISLLLILPPLLGTARGWALLIGVAAAASLVFSWVRGFLARRAPLGLDALDAVGFIVLGLVLPDQGMVMSTIFAAVWFRSMYGTTRQGMLRCGMFSSAILATVLLSPGGSGGAAPAPGFAVVGSLPTMFLTAFIGHHLGRGLLAREQGLERDRALSAAGTQMLGTIDPDAIRSAAWTAGRAIAAASPGLRLIKAVREGRDLRLAGAVGEFRGLPEILEGGAVQAGAEGSVVRLTVTGPLDAAAGAVLEWTAMSMESPGEDVWVLMGGAQGVLRQAESCVRGLANQVSLALRNSTAHRELAVQARFDALTGLDNRASFLSNVTAGLHPAAATGHMHILFLDLDDFKDVNDGWGHRAGDELLITVAARLRAGTRPGDDCARLGGDEFAIVFYDVTDAEAVDIAQRLVDSIARPFRLPQGTVRVGASIGVAASGHGQDMETLVHQADVAMYAAKAHGKGRVQLFEPGLLQTEQPRLSLESQVAAAADLGQLRVHYQPILSVPDRKVTAIEALVRWQHPERGLLGPVEFIGVAERTGTISAIGAFVLRQACIDAASLRATCPEEQLAVHVNASAIELDQDDFVTKVKDCLTETETSPATLVLELTETAALSCPDAIRRLEDLAGLGITIAVDDFGTGYSSLSTLCTVPLGILKLDASLVQGATTDAVRRGVVSAVTRLGRELDLRTVAEGVETAAHNELMTTIGVDSVQGYYHARPMAFQELQTWLAQQRTPSPSHNLQEQLIHKPSTARA
ncbi:bifunctional diguanylate cyclase/phosphodiesterase [Arthrobacter sp. SO5]|uniref:putative bifunctional diguanylate cyclase/phosphodiesterase n=1 Tax=Arthrobacter sp. SO5 TaxID=1897055 RepID=UPI001E60DB90|nr:EAL domain-containing protein [Arthrobacter sp. SO5]